MLLDRARRPGRADHRLVRPAWRRRAVAKELPDLVARTGVRFDPVATIFKLPELLRRGDGVRWLNLAEWVVHALGGDEVAEMSLAGRTGLCDLHTGDVVARRPRVPRRRRARSCPASPVRRRRRRDGRRSHPIAGARLAVAGHDHQVAAYVAGAIEPGCLFESLGTADALTLTVPAPIDAATVLAAADVGATVGRTVVADRLMVMTGCAPARSSSASPASSASPDRDERLALSARAAQLDARPDARGRASPTGCSRSPASATTPMPQRCGWRPSPPLTSARLTLVEQYAELFGPATGVVVGGGWLNDPTIEAAVAPPFPTARRSRFGEPGAVGAACIAGISAGVLDGPFADADDDRRRIDND